MGACSLLIASMNVLRESEGDPAGCFEGGK